MTAVAESISNGNMTGWGSTAYTWDELGRLVAINGTSLDASYKYDALGRRTAKTINNTTTRYLYDGADIVLEMNENDAATIYYIRTLNIDEPLARIELDSGGIVTGIRFYLADALGSTIALTDENGDIKTRYNYTPFGEPEIIEVTEGSDNPFMFTGREYDEGTGLYYYRARYYSWELGRFISEDPIGLAGGINMYAYVGNSPLNFVDPLGLHDDANAFGSALVGFDFDDFVSDAIEREGSRVAEINEQNRKKAEQALKWAERWDLRVKALEVADDTVNCIPPGEVGPEGSLILILLQYDIKYELDRSDANAAGWWYWYHYYKNIPREEPNFRLPGYEWSSANN